MAKASGEPLWVGCPVEGCQVLHRRRDVMCREHWRLVPIGLQRKISELYRKDPGGRLHLAAIRAAIAAVEKPES